MHISTDSYVWRAVGPIGHSLRDALKSPLQEMGVRAFVQIFFRSGDYFYPCYLTNWDDTPKVLKAISPILKGATASQTAFLREVFGCRDPQFWLWGLSNEEHLRTIVNRRIVDYNALPKDLLVAALCRVNETQGMKKLSPWPTTDRSARLGFRPVVDSISQSIESLRKERTVSKSNELAIVDSAFAIEIASLLLAEGELVGPARKQRVLVASDITEYAESGNLEKLSRSLQDDIKGEFVANICIPLNIGNALVGLLNLVLMRRRRPNRVEEIKIKAQIESPLRETASQLAQLLLALLPLWVVYRKASGMGESVSFVRLLQLPKDERTSLDIISSAADMVGELISLTRELELSWKAILATQRCKQVDAVAYALAKVAFDLREHLFAGRVLVIPNSGKPIGTAVPGSFRHGSNFLMSAAGFDTPPIKSGPRSPEYYECKIDEQCLRVEKNKISVRLRGAAAALETRWGPTSNVGFHKETVDSHSVGLIVVWARAWERDQRTEFKLTQEDWLLALRTAARISANEPQPSGYKNFPHSSYVDKVMDRVLLISEVKELISTN